MGVFVHVYIRAMRLGDYKIILSTAFFSHPWLEHLLRRRWWQSIDALEDTCVFVCFYDPLV